MTTDSVLLIADWLLVLVFATSGAFKVRQPFLAAMAIVDFRVATRVDRRFGFLLGFFELGLAGALATPLAPIYPRALAAGLLLAFSILIARSLARGETFACFCFGESDSRLSRWTFARTAFLASIAVLLVPFSDKLQAARLTTFEQIPFVLIAASILSGAFLLSRVPTLVHLNSQWIVKR